MKLNCLLSVLCLTCIAGAWKGKEPKDHAWHPAGLQDSRSPCPGLNALANHDWLPHSGKDIDLAAIHSATSGAFNFDPEVFNVFFNRVQSFGLSTTGNFSTFNLGDLGRHDTIEFDGSLSRNDIYFGCDLHFDPKIWSFTAEKLGLYDDKDQAGPYVTVETAARARAARVADAMRVNPTFNASSAQMSGSPGTTSLYLLTLWNDAANATYKDWVRAFFEQERIPYLEGYERSDKQKTQADLNAMFERVIKVPV